MSYNDREGTKEWEDRLKDFYIKQDDLNKLIMNYLINGSFVFHDKQNKSLIRFVSSVIFRGLQGSGGEVSRGVGNRAGRRLINIGQQDFDSRGRSAGKNSRIDRACQSVTSGAVGQRPLLVLPSAAVASY